MTHPLPDFLAIPPMAVIPPGNFQMGAGSDDKFGNMLEMPRHTVSISRAFQLATHPITFSQWDAYASLTGSWSPPDYGRGRESHPVSSISWNDATAFATWLSSATCLRYRLPTEAEWEYACRAGTTGTFHTGDDIPLSLANYWYSENGEKIGLGSTKPVQSYPPNAFGLYDMHGSICELVQDSWSDGYSGLPSDGSAHVNPCSDLVVTRGGAWDYPPRLLRSSFRDWLPRSSRLDNIGFRLALDP